MLSIPERIALALTAPAVAVVTAIFIINIGGLIGISELAAVGALILVFCSSISILSSFVGVIYLAVNVRRLRPLVQIPCWFVNIAWLALMFLFALPHSIPR